MEDKTIAENIVQYSTLACSYQIEKRLELLVINDQTFGYRIITIGDKDIYTELITFDKSTMLENQSERPRSVWQ